MKMISVKNFYTRIVTGASLALLVISLFFLPPWVFTLLVGIILVRILIREWPRLFNPKKLDFWLLMPVYPLLSFTLIMYMHLYGYEVLNMLLIVLVGAHDSGSYLTGIKWGKTKISPEISPGKTWEGFAGGVVLATVISLIFFGHNSPYLIVSYIFPLVFVICSAALMGDLFESYLKRRAGIKDAGAILPGHGGFLDRIDGILFAAPLIFLFRNTISYFLAS
jgi:phosphatidate cytidylyltransferase